MCQGTIECKLCGHTFIRKSSLKRHLSEQHTSKRFSCDICQSVYTSRRALTDHLDGAHSEKRLLCPKCGSEYKWRQSLNRHMKTCQGETPVNIFLPVKWKYGRKKHLYVRPGTWEYNMKKHLYVPAGTYEHIVVFIHLECTQSHYCGYASVTKYSQFWKIFLWNTGVFHEVALTEGDF